MAPWDSTDPLHSTPKLQCSQCQDAAVLLPHTQGRQPSPVHPANSTPHEHICAPTTSHLRAAQSKHRNAEEGELTPPMLPG